MIKTYFHSHRKVLLLALIVSLLVGAGISQADASIPSFITQSALAEPYPETNKAEEQPTSPNQAEDPVPLVAAADLRNPESDPPPPSEIRQTGTLMLSRPSVPDDELKPAPGASAPELKPASHDPELAPEDITEPTVQAAGWSSILSENFEGAFPTGLWNTYDGDDPTNIVYWAADDYKPHWGVYSAWAARGGRDGLDPSYYYYPSYCNSWMVYGPFDLSDATDAELLFYYWNLSELNYDLFGWYASIDGAYFYGTRVSGNSEGWLAVNFDLTSVPYLGNVTGDSSVWIAFVFTSNGPNLSDGPFVDDIVLQKFIPPVQPNLSPYAPSGWDYPIVPSSATGTHTVSTLYTDQATFIDWAVLNNGGSTSTTFTNCLYYDNSPINCWDRTGALDQGYYLYVQDWTLNLTPTPGTHTLKIITDVNNTIAESNESDNTWERSFTWIGPAQANLKPYMPNGWDYPIVPSTATGTHTVSTLYTAQNTYIDWAVINNGAGTSTAFTSCLYYDNGQVNCWNTSGGLNQNQYAYIQDWILNQAPTAGAHSLKIITDVYNTVAESNESDNTWEHAFIWLASSYTVYLPSLLREYMAYFEGPGEVEPNNTSQQANGPLRSGQNYSSYPNDEKDYFSIYLRTGGPIVINLSNHTGLEPQLQLFYQTTSNPPVAADIEAPYHIEYTGSAGWYYIYIHAAGNYSSSTAYTLQVTYP